MRKVVCWVKIDGADFLIRWCRGDSIDVTDTFCMKVFQDCMKLPILFHKWKRFTARQNCQEDLGKQTLHTQLYTCIVIISVFVPVGVFPYMGFYSRNGCPVVCLGPFCLSLWAISSSVWKKFLHNRGCLSNQVVPSYYESDLLMKIGKITPE